MQSVSPTRRLSAIVALVAVVAMLAVAVVGLLQRPLVLLVATACLGVAIAAAAYALTRTGARRLVAAVVAILALAAPLALVVTYGRLLQLLLLITLIVTGICWPPNSKGFCATAATRRLASASAPSSPISRQMMANSSPP